MLEKTRREIGGVGWPGCGVVDIALVQGGWRQSWIVANMLENTWREFGGVGWPGCDVVDIALVQGGWRQSLQKQNSREAHAGIS
jgi:hypothetical protein